MEAKLDEILTEVRLLRDEVRTGREELRSLRENFERHLLAKPLSPSRADDLIGVEYVATRVGLSARTILAGKAGTKELLKKRIQKHPSRWKRADVDAFITDLVKAKEALRRNNFSLVRRRKRRK